MLRPFCFYILLVSEFLSCKIAKFRQKWRKNTVGIEFEKYSPKSFLKTKNRKTMRTLAVRPQHGRVAFGNFFDTFFDNDFANFEAVKTPVLVNTIETKDAYKLEIAAPGFEKDQVKISVDGQLLTISAEKESEKLNDASTSSVTENYTRREFGFVSFKRSFNLPKTVSAEKISADYKNGILAVVLPKMEEAKAKGTIEVKVG